jgi:hypothetical protein
MIHLFGPGGDANRLSALARHVGQFFEDDRATASEVITVLTIMLVKVAKHAGIDRERIFNFLAARWQDQEPAPLIMEGIKYDQ